MKTFIVSWAYTSSHVSADAAIEDAVQQMRLGNISPEVEETDDAPACPYCGRVFDTPTIPSHSISWPDGPMQCQGSGAEL